MLTFDSNLRCFLQLLTPQCCWQLDEQGLRVCQIERRRDNRAGIH